MSSKRLKQTTVQLSAVTAAVIEGPGDDWLFVVRGTRANRTAARKVTRKGRPQAK
jgi:hypothetical protein